MGKARTCDPTAGFPMDLVTGGLCRLHKIHDGQLIPNLDSAQTPPVCPITLSPFEDPVLLEDGFVYEQAAIVKWLEIHSNAPCTNKKVRNLRLLRLDPFRIVVNNFLDTQRDQIGNDWKKQLLQVEEEASCLSNPLPIRCAKVEQAIAACTAKALELEAGLEAARCTANRLRAELRCCQEKEIVKLQRAARCWLSRRILRGLQITRLLKLVRSSMQVHAARKRLARLDQGRSRAVLRIQRWWKQRFKRNAKRAKRQRQRQLKKDKQKAMQELANWSEPLASLEGWKFLDRVLPGWTAFADDDNRIFFYCEESEEVYQGVTCLADLMKDVSPWRTVWRGIDIETPCPKKVWDAATFAAMGELFPTYAWSPCKIR